MRSQLAILAVFIALLIPISFATITSMQLSGSIASSGSVDLLIKAELENSAGKALSLTIPGELDSVVVKDRSGLELPYTSSKSGNNTVITAEVPVDYLQFNIKSDSFTAKTAAEWQFDFTLGASDYAKDISASLKLPSGAVLKSTNGAVQGSGDSLTIMWNAQSLDTSNRIHLRAGYELTQTPLDFVPVIIAIVFILGIIVAFLLITRKKQIRSPAPEKTIEPSALQPPSKLEENAVFKTLDETDKEIVREIMAQGGKTTQAHLYLHTHVPKATLSRRIASLENRGIIAKSQKGNRNLITLTEIFKG